MIFYDLPYEIPGGKISSGLRSRCGADVVLSKKAFPPTTQAMIQKHSDSGCIFYRVLRVKDLLESSIETLLFNLSKLSEFNTKPWQCILVIDDSHNALLGYEHYVSKVDAWVDHGGSSLTTYKNPFELFITHKEKTFLEKADNRTVLVPNFAPRKEIEVIKDWTITLATFPGVGWKGAQVIRKIINEKNLGDDLLTAIWYLTDWDEYQKSDKTWKEIREKARRWIGLPDGLNLDIGIKAEENGSSI